MANIFSLEGKNAWVTGAAYGIGFAIAKAFVEAGVKNIIFNTSNEASMEKGLEAYKEAGITNVHGYVCDVTDEVAVKALVERIHKEIGQIDILVNNAGFAGKVAPLAEQDDADIAAVIATNLTGAIMGSARVAKGMSKRRRGVIVNVSSICALHAWPGWSVYTAAKAGLLKFSRALHTEMRPYGVRVSCLIPSWGQTGFNRAAGISGASEDPKLAKKCIAPSEIGKIVADLITLPDHLAVPELVVQPMVQEIIPM